MPKIVRAADPEAKLQQALDEAEAGVDAWKKKQAEAKKRLDAYYAARLRDRHIAAGQLLQAVALLDADPTWLRLVLTEVASMLRQVGPEEVLKLVSGWSEQEGADDAKD